AHHMAGEFWTRPQRAVAIDVGGAAGARRRFAAQAVVVGEAELIDPLGGGAAPLAAHGVVDASDARQRCARDRQRLAAVPAGARAHGASRGGSSLLAGRAEGSLKTISPCVATGGSAYRAPSTIIHTQPASEAMKIARPSQATGCRYQWLWMSCGVFMGKRSSMQADLSQGVPGHASRSGSGARRRHRGAIAMRACHCCVRAGWSA